VKAQILDDCRRMGSEAGRSVASARAAFHTSLACLLGFGTSVDVPQALDWATKSAFKGLQSASTLRELITETIVQDKTTDSHESRERYTRIVRDSFRRLDISYLDAIPSTTTITFQELKQIESDHNRVNQENHVSTPFYFAHYAVLHGLTSFLQRHDNVNLQDGLTGETALVLACKLGDIQAVLDLLKCGANPSIATNDGCFPIHFLCMFQPEIMKLAAFLLLGPPETLLLAVAGTPGYLTKRVKRALVRFRYEKIESNELDLIIGEYITVTKMVDTVWWEGIDLTGARGLFPRGYVEIVGEKTAEVNTNYAFSRDVQPPRPLPKTFTKHAVVLSDLNHSLHLGDSIGMLDLTKGEYVTVVKMVDEQWWFGGNSEGKYGLFPSSFVEVETDRMKNSDILQSEGPLHATEDAKALETQPEKPKSSIDKATFADSEPISPLSSTTLPVLEHATGQGLFRGENLVSFPSPLLQVQVDEWFVSAKGSRFEVLQSPVNNPQYLDPQLPLQ
jgi:hypothetical protein